MPIFIHKSFKDQNDFFSLLKKTLWESKWNKGDQGRATELSTELPTDQMSCQCDGENGFLQFEGEYARPCYFFPFKNAHTMDDWIEKFKKEKNKQDGRILLRIAESPSHNLTKNSSEPIGKSAKLIAIIKICSLFVFQFISLFKKKR